MISIPGITTGFQNIPIEQMDLSGCQQHIETPEERDRRMLGAANSKGFGSGIFDQMKSDILSKYPKVQTLGRLWRFKSRGGLISEQTVTWLNNQETYRITFVTIQIKGKEYWRKWGPLNPSSL